MRQRAALVTKLQTWMGRALEWLEPAWHLRDAGLEYLKVDPLLGPPQRSELLQPRALETAVTAQIPPPLPLDASSSVRLRLRPSRALRATD